MRRFLIAAIAPLFLLAACAAPGRSGPLVQITRAEVAQSALLAAATLETVWQGYLAGGRKRWRRDRQDQGGYGLGCVPGALQRPVGQPGINHADRRG